MAMLLHNEGSHAMRLFHRSCLAATVWLMASAAWAGPFGVTMGAPVSSYNGRPLSADAYRITAPVPNSEFESYTAIATREAGICKVWGVGRNHDSDRYGVEVRAAYDRLKTLLDGKYGAGDQIAFLKSGALWSGENEWVMSVRQKERTVITYWTNDKHSFPDGIVAISLEVKALSADIAYLDLTYEFANFDKCKATFVRKASDGL